MTVTPRNKGSKLVFILVWIGCVTCKLYEVQNSWDTGFQGEINIPIKKDTEFGWKLEIKFHKPIESFECWVGKLKSSEQGEFGSKYVYTNFNYNKILESGAELKVEFNGRFIGKSGPKVPPVTIKFQNKVIYSDYYDMANDPVTVSTTDIVFVLNSLTKATASTVPRNNNRQTNNEQSPPVINEVDVEDSRNTNINEINNRNNQRVQNMNNDANEQSRDKTNEGESNTSSENTNFGDYDDDMGSGEEFLGATIPPGRRPARRTKYPYIRAIQKSLLFYEAQRSGLLPEDNRIEWRGDSALRDRGQDGEDLTGGYYDAGDHVKFGYPMAFSITTLAWGVIEYWEAYQQAGELENALKALKWGTDYILKAYVGRYEFYGQVGHGEKDHKYWGRPEDMHMERPAFKITAAKPGSDLAAESSAALSSSSIAFQRYANRPFALPGYLKKLRNSAEGLYLFATKFQGKYQKSIKDAETYYPSTNYLDEIVWSAAWLYRATGKTKYLLEAEGKYQNWGMFKLPEQFIFSWDDKTVGAQLLLSQITNEMKSANYLARATSYCKEIRDNRKRYTRKGLLFMDEWSPLRYAANIAFICLMTADQGGDSTLNFGFAQKQIHYMLGDTGRSYVVGFGRKYPKFPHHRGSSCKLNDRSCNWGDFNSMSPNPMILHGALVGGPNRKDVFVDERKNFKSTEVTLDHNSCFQGALAGLLQRSIIGIERPNNRSHEPWYYNMQTTTTTIRTSTTTLGSSPMVMRPCFYFLTFLCMLVNLGLR
ncbi:uncharacterized protein LOC120343563 [Styela clava]